MKVKSALLFSCFAAGVIALAGCSSMSKNKNGAPVTNAVGGEGGAYSQGMGSETDFGTSVRAPANQTYHFDYDRDTVHQEDYASIQAQAKYLVAHPSATVKVEGNTDNRGSREYNIGLGWRRAKAVAALLQQYGVSSKQIITISYGAEKPVAVGDNEDAYAKNRRVDLVYKSY
ncbi:MAG: peptidoglycan-associated lipoprotein Pal [Coxiellaceae bacterium]|nr:MAG: peptidoglycan-associated lipoprotein Pal [Coxiellaceae bacterium]